MTDNAVDNQALFIRTLLNAAPIPIFYKDVEGRYLDCNTAFTAFLGLPRSTIIGSSAFDIAPDEQAHKYHRMDLELIARGGTQTYASEVITARGPRHVVFHKSVVTDSRGKPSGLVGAITDITAQRSAEAALKSSLSLLDSALDSTADGILVVNRNGRVAKWNRKFIELWQIPDSLAREVREDRLIAHLLDQLVHPQGFLERVQALYAHPEESSLDLIDLADGRCFERYSQPQWLGDDIVGRVWSFRDITEKKRAARSLQEETARLRSITDSTQDAIIMMDHRGAVTFWNPAAVNILGYHGDEAIGQNLHTLLAPRRFLDDHRKAFPHFLSTGEGDAVGKTVELMARRKDGQEIAIALSLSAVSLQGDWHAVGIIRDITHQKQAERELLETNRQLQAETARANRMAAEAESANIAKSEFLANMSHEIRTPMNGIIGMTGLLLDTQLDEEQRRCTEIARGSAETLLRLINDILDFSKIEASRLDLESLDFDLERQLSDFASTLAFQAHEKGLEFISAVDPSVPTRLRGDPGRLRQILTNLAGNAVKFTQAGEVAIRVSLIDETRDGVRLRFSVSDTGIGVPIESQRNLFQPFTQVDASTTRKFGGTGLGLAISRQLVELMGGEIGVASEERQGAEFWFTVHLEKQRGEMRAEPPPAPVAAGTRALIVDDNATSRTHLGKHLAAWGMRTGEVADGPDALDALTRAVDRQDPFQLALIDLQMPGMDGDALLRTIRADHRLNALKTVVLIPLGIPVGDNRQEGAGFDAWLNKPVGNPALSAVLATLLGNPESAARVMPHEAPDDATAALIRRMASGGKARILIAEDNPANQEVALGMLKRLGLTADAVANGREVLEALAIIPYSLVLMDVQMPEMDGFETTRRIRDVTSSVLDHRIPVIALTAYALAGDRDRCLRAGMNGYLSKPIVPEALADALTTWLFGRPGSDAAADGRQPTSAPKPAGRSAAVWDRQALLGRLLGDADLARTIVAGFLEELPAQLEAIAGMLQADDVAGIERQAHMIKGAAANIGGMALSEAAKAMEKTAGAGTVNSLTQRLDALKEQFAALQRAMEAYLK